MGRPAVLAVRLLRHVRLRDVGQRLRRFVLGLRLRRHLCRPVRALRLRRPHRLPAAIRQYEPGQPEPASPASATPTAATDQLAQMCGEDSHDIAGLPIDQFQQAIQPTDAQRAALDDLANASLKAAQDIKAACPTDIALTAPSRLAAMQQRIEAMIAAVADRAAAAGEILRSPERRAEGASDRARQRSASEQDRGEARRFARPELAVLRNPA